jgi:hypothetical protein
MKTTESEIRNFFAFCRNATTPQLREIITRERAAGRGEDALIAEIVLDQREMEQNAVEQTCIQGYSYE